MNPDDLSGSLKELQVLIEKYKNGFFIEEQEKKMARSEVTNDELRTIKNKLASVKKPGELVTSTEIREYLAQLENPILISDSQLRSRYIGIGEPLSGSIGQPKVKEIDPSSKSSSLPLEIIKKSFEVPTELKKYIPKAEEFVSYIERKIDKRLAIHYNSSRPGNWKYPLTQGPQGTGKTFSHQFYAYKMQLPFFLFCAFEDFKLHKLFGDKTIINGNVVFKESLFTTAIQYPCVILIDEVNYISNENSVDFHALLQNRELFVKDADNGNGKIYKLHEECRIGFAQNPKSAKYIGGNIKPSSFLGRCTYLTYPNFSAADITRAIKVRFPNLIDEDVKNFTVFFLKSCEAIENNQIPVDISIRQLNNVIDLYNHGMPLNEAVEDGLASIMEAASQPKSKEAFVMIAKGTWSNYDKKTIYQ